MAKTDSINASTPPDTGEAVKFGALRIRELKLALIELLGIDHYLGTAVNGNYSEDAAGKHKQITFVGELAAKPTLSATDDDTGVIYIREDTVTETNELFFLDAADNEIQLTRGGKLFAQDVLRMYSASTPDADFGAFSEIQFLKTLSTDDSALMAKITGSHFGTSSDKKGVIQLLVNTGAEAYPETTGLEVRPTGIVLLPTSGLPISNVTDPVAAQDAATKNYVDRLTGDVVDSTTTVELVNNAEDVALLTVTIACHAKKCLVKVDGGWNANGNPTVTLTLKSKILPSGTETTLGDPIILPLADSNNNTFSDMYAFSMARSIAAASVNDGNQSFTLYGKRSGGDSALIGNRSMIVQEVN